MSKDSLYFKYFHSSFHNFTICLEYCISTQFENRVIVRIARFILVLTTFSQIRQVWEPMLEAEESASILSLGTKVVGDPLLLQISKMTILSTFRQWWVKITYTLSIFIPFLIISLFVSNITSAPSLRIAMPNIIRREITGFFLVLTTFSQIRRVWGPPNLVILDFFSFKFFGGFFPHLWTTKLHSILTLRNLAMRSVYEWDDMQNPRLQSGTNSSTDGDCGIPRISREQCISYRFSPVVNRRKSVVGELITRLISFAGQLCKWWYQVVTLSQCRFATRWAKAQ